MELFGIIFFTVILFGILVVLPLFSIFILVLFKKSIKKKIKNGESVFSASFKSSYQANFILWLLLTIFCCYICNIEISVYVALTFLTVYFIVTTITTLTTGLLFSYLEKYKSDKKSKKHVRLKSSTLNTDAAASNQLKIKEQHVSNYHLTHTENTYFSVIKKHIDSPYATYSVLVIITIYAMLYRMYFEDIYDIIPLCIFPIIIVCLPAIFNQIEMQKSLIKQFFYPTIGITIFFFIGMINTLEDTLFLIILLYLPFVITTGLTSMIIFLFHKLKK